ncbi:hypothetical protein KSF81_04810 [Siccirubricoccus sp. G192]|nr:hypothetical protein [Siccirubricoccus sp. G192]
MKTIDRAGLAALLADASRTTHVLDVRDPAEYAAGHLAGSRSAPGGQLVQGTDGWVAVRGARIVLVDDTGVRARMTGGWLRQLGGWEVFVLTDGLEGRLEEGAWQPDCPEAAALHPATVTPPELAALLAGGGGAGGAVVPLGGFPRGASARRALGCADPAGRAGAAACRRPRRGGGGAGRRNGAAGGAGIAGAGTGAGEGAGGWARRLEGGRAAAAGRPPHPDRCQLHRCLSPPL